MVGEMDLQLVRNRDKWLSIERKISSLIYVNRCCFFFTLREGAIVIGIVELCLTSFVLFLLVLGFSYAQEMLSIASADLNDLEEGHSISIDKSNLLEKPVYYSKNEKLMLSGRCLAELAIIVLSAGICIASVHIISCVLLLYGVFKSIPQLMIPWNLTGIIPIFFAGIILTIFPCKGEVWEFVLWSAFFILEIHMYLVVFCYYRNLNAKQHSGLYHKCVTVPQKYVTTKDCAIYLPITTNTEETKEILQV